MRVVKKWCYMGTLGITIGLSIGSVLKEIVTLRIMKTLRQRIVGMVGMFKEFRD